MLAAVAILQVATAAEEAAIGEGESRSCCCQQLLLQWGLSP
jgi:hypothetical protein